MTVNNAFTPSISLAVSPYTIVYNGQVVTFTATIANGGSTATISWLKNNVVIPGQNGTVWQAVAGTDFQDNDAITAVLYTSDPCATIDSVTSSEKMYIRGVGISTTAAPDGFNLYPNPNESGIVVLEGLHQGDKVILHDLTGKVLDVYHATGSGKEIWQLKNAPAGVYYVACLRADASARWNVKLIRR